MANRLKRAPKFGYILRLGLIYALTVAFVWYCFHPYQSRGEVIRIDNTSTVKNGNNVALVSGTPTRLVIPGSAIDIPIDKGYFNPNTDSWTLSGYRAQFDTASAPANNIAGNTFVYGHNNDFVFGSLRHNTPVTNASAYVYTNNGHILQYSFSKVFSLGPTDTSVLVYSGPSTLTVQTCTGSLNEWRTMFVFNFDKVVS